MDCLTIVNNLFQYMRDQISWENYDNFRRSPPEVLEDKRANCVDKAYTIDTILYCKYKISCRFVFAKVDTPTSTGSNHVWPQINCNGKYIDFDANSPNFKLGVTFPIEKVYSILPDLERFGCPPLTCKMDVLASI